MKSNELDELDELENFDDPICVAEGGSLNSGVVTEGFDLEKIEAGVRLILEGLGEDTSRSGIAPTPGRVARMYAEICSGLKHDPQQYIKLVPAETHDEMVIVRDISIF